MMYIGNDLIEAIPLNLGQISQPGYLGKFKRNLKQKYALLIQEASQEPEFLLVDTTPKAESPKPSVSTFHVTVTGSLQAPGFL